MKNKLKIFIFLTIIWTCNAHLRLLGEILSSAHDRIHSKVQNAAGALIGGISHGLDFNVGGHVGINGQRHPGQQGGYNPNTQSGDTVVVVIKEEDNHGNYGPPNPNFQRPPPPPPFNMHEYGPNNRRPPYDNPHRDDNYINGQQNRPNYGNNYPDNQYQGNGNFNNYPNYQNNNNNHGRPDPGHPHDNYNPNNNFNHPYQNNNEHQQVSPTVPFDKSTQSPEKPSTEFINKKPEYKPTTNKPVDDDAPFFIPLNPDEYSYGGDKINITAPKRDTNNNAEPEDENFNIDIRIKDE